MNVLHAIYILHEHMFRSDWSSDFYQLTVELAELTGEKRTDLIKWEIQYASNNGLLKSDEPNKYFKNK